MRCVVDRNYLQTPELEAFLLENPENQVVLIDFAGIEGYAGNPLKNAVKSIQIIRRHSDQVLVLKSTRAIIQLGEILTKDWIKMVDADQTSGFANYCRAVTQADSGYSRPVAEIKRLGASAQAHLDFMKDQMQGIVEYIEHFKGIAGDELMDSRRRGTPMPLAASLRLIEAMQDLASMLFENDETVPSIPQTAAEARHYFLFRYAVATTLLALRWATNGGAITAKNEVLRNDVVDLSYIAHATYFDGLLTKDAKMSDIYAETRVLIENVFAPRDGSETVG